MPQKIIAGNWKMNMLRKTGKELAQSLSEKVNGWEKATVIIFPPMSILGEICSLSLGKIGVGAQDVASEKKSFGAFTGDVSAEMVRDLGANYTLVGHSERRAAHQETDKIVCEKAQNALNSQLKVVACVGETEQQRLQGKALEIVKNQVLNSLPEQISAKNTVVAYEPVWAIGTGKVPTLQDIQQMHSFIRNTISQKYGEQIAKEISILYGGSVKPSNAKEILELPDVDGALVGGASLKIDDFWAIMSAIN